MRVRLRMVLAAGAVLASGMAMVVSPGPASAGGLIAINVTTTDDVLVAPGADVSLREAFTIASTDVFANAIILQAGQTYELDLCGVSEEDANASGDLDHGAPLDLQIETAGTGNTSSIVQTCDGERVIEDTSASGNLRVMDGVTVTGGDTTEAGGGIRSDGSVGIIDGARVVGNASGDSGGGVRTPTIVVVHDSTISDNRAVGNGGGVSAESVILLRASVFQNRAGGRGGGIRAGDYVDVSNSTISRNRAGDDGGGIRADGDSAILSSTVTANRATFGANVFVSAPGELSIRGSIIALGSNADPPGTGSDCSASAGIVNQGDNVGDDGSCGTGGDPDDRPGVHPMLAPLAFNGGPSENHRPMAPSPAVDVYDDLPACEQADDQRGVDRPVGALCDSGSVESAPPACTQQFSDVAVSHPFFEEICWMAQVGITTGFNDGTFKPGGTVSRESMAAFTFRLAMAPLYVGPVAPSFTDVPVSSTFFDEVEWMADEEITGGFPDGTYKPAQAVTRQAMAAFLYRVAGEPAFVPPVTPTFSDVPVSHPFFAEIEWMADEGVSIGFPDDTWRPGQSITRQAMAAFMLNLAADVELAGL